jgi:hypothetical protein
MHRAESIQAGRNYMEGDLSKELTTNLSGGFQIQYLIALSKDREVSNLRRKPLLSVLFVKGIP